MHEALESFAEEVRKRGMKWTELTEQERNEIADRCLDNIVADYGNTVLKSSARNEYMIERTKENPQKDGMGTSETVGTGRISAGRL